MNCHGCHGVTLLIIFIYKSCVINIGARRAPRKAGVCSGESGSFLGGKSTFAPRKVRGLEKALKRHKKGHSRVPQDLVNNVDFV